MLAAAFTLPFRSSVLDRSLCQSSVSTSRGCCGWAGPIDTGTTPGCGWLYLCDGPCALEGIQGIGRGVHDIYRRNNGNGTCSISNRLSCCTYDALVQSTGIPGSWSLDRLRYSTVRPKNRNRRSRCKINYPAGSPVSTDATRARRQPGNSSLCNVGGQRCGLGLRRQWLRVRNV